MDGGLLNISPKMKPEPAVRPTSEEKKSESDTNFSWVAVVFGTWARRPIFTCFILSVQSILLIKLGLLIPAFLTTCLCLDKLATIIHSRNAPGYGRQGLSSVTGETASDNAKIPVQASEDSDHLNGHAIVCNQNAMWQLDKHKRVVIPLERCTATLLPHHCLEFGLNLGKNAYGTKKPQDLDAEAPTPHSDASNHDNTDTYDIQNHKFPNFNSEISITNTTPVTGSKDGKGEVELDTDDRTCIWVRDKIPNVTECSQQEKAFEEPKRTENPDTPNSGYKSNGKREDENGQGTASGDDGGRGSGRAGGDAGRGAGGRGAGGTAGVGARRRARVGGRRGAGGGARGAGGTAGEGVGRTAEGGAGREAGGTARGSTGRGPEGGTGRGVGGGTRTGAGGGTGGGPEGGTGRGAGESTRRVAGGCTRRGPEGGTGRGVVGGTGGGPEGGTGRGGTRRGAGGGTRRGAGGGTGGPEGGTRRGAGGGVGGGAGGGGKKNGNGNKKTPNDGQGRTEEPEDDDDEESEEEDEREGHTTTLHPLPVDAVVMFNRSAATNRHLVARIQFPAEELHAEEIVVSCAATNNQALTGNLLLTLFQLILHTISAQAFSQHQQICAQDPCNPGRESRILPWIRSRRRAQHVQWNVADLLRILGALGVRFTVQLTTDRRMQSTLEMTLVIAPTSFQPRYHRGQAEMLMVLPAASIPHCGYLRAVTEAGSMPQGTGSSSPSFRICSDGSSPALKTAVHREGPPEIIQIPPSIRAQDVHGAESGGTPRNDQSTDEEFHFSVPVQCEDTSNTGPEEDTGGNENASGAAALQFLPERLELRRHVSVHAQCEEDVEEARFLAAQQEHTRLRRRLLCRCCYLKNFEVVLMPCAHLLCFDCVCRVRPICPVCRRMITRAAWVYLQ